MMTSQPLLADLNAYEQSLLRAIATWREDDLPTAVSLSRVSDYSVAGVRKAFPRLESKGFLKIRALNNGRLITPTLTDLARRALGLGRDEGASLVRIEGDGEELRVWPVECGALAVADPEMDAAAIVLTNPRDYFPTFIRGRDEVIFARGASMIEPGNFLKSIYPGSFVHVRTDEMAQVGQEVWVEHDMGDGRRDCTLKLFYPLPSENFVRLVPRNPDFETLYLPADEVIVKGVVKDWMLLRSAIARYSK